MLISRNKVEKFIKLALVNINSRTKTKDEFNKKLKERGFATGEAMAILTGHNPLVQINEELLYLLTTICNEVTTDEGIKLKLDPKKILTDKEFAIAKSVKMERKSDSIYPIVIENVNFDMEDDYSTVFSIEKLSELFDNRIIKYNPETQRPLISKWYNNQEIKEVFISNKNRMAIEKNIEEGKQVPNYITLNILANGEEDFEYNPSKRTLTIYSGEIDLLDGFHRTLSARNVFAKDPSVQFNFKIRITHWDIDKAKAFIHQETLGTQIDPLARKSYDVYNEVNQVVNKLNENPKSVLRNKITTDESRLRDNKALIMFNVVFDSINYFFKIKDNKEVVKVSNHIRNVLGLVVEMQPSILDKPIDPKMFSTYIALAADCYGSSDWEEYILNHLTNEDINKVLNLEFKKFNKTFAKNIKDIIESVV